MKVHGRTTNASLGGALFAALGSLLLAPGAQAVQITTLTKFSGAYSVELEINDFPNAAAVDLVHPDSGRQSLVFDSGEGNWDLEIEGLTLAQLNAFFGDSFALEITRESSLSVYTADVFGAFDATDFPQRASSLTVGPSANPLRPTATWVGGDETVDAMIITYEKGDDEFTDGFEPPEADGSRTIGQDLEPGDYGVTLGYYSFLEPVSLALTEGDDVLGISEILPATVAETFSSTTVVPLPAAAWLLISAFAILVLPRSGLRVRGRVVGSTASPRSSR